MKGMILYTSKHGTTKRYAQWLAEETGFDCAETKKMKIRKVREYDTVIVGGWVYASRITGLSFLKKSIGQLKGKNVIVFCCGAAPAEDEVIRKIIGQNLKDELADLPFFYCRGAFDMSAMSFPDRMLCGMLQRSVAKKKPEERDALEKALVEAGEEKRDWTDRSYIAPILDAIGRNGA